MASGEPDRNRPDHQLIAADGDEQGQADEAKTSWLAACISTSTMTLAAAIVPRTPLQRQAPRADEIAADLRQRQQRVGAFAHEAQGRRRP